MHIDQYQVDIILKYQFDVQLPVKYHGYSHKSVQHPAYLQPQYSYKKADTLFDEWHQVPIHSYHNSL